MRLLNRLFRRRLKLTAPLQPGDMAVIQTRSRLGDAIRWASGWLKDPGVYTHALIITSPTGDVLEAEWRFGPGKLTEYVGDKILIVRDLGMTPEAFAKGMAAVTPDIGALYPVWRLPLFLVGIDKYFKFGAGVCSEEVAKFWVGTGLDEELMGKLLLVASSHQVTQIYGLTPDDLSMAWRKEIADGKMIAVYDGVL